MTVGCGVRLESPALGVLITGCLRTSGNPKTVRPKNIYASGLTTGIMLSHGLTRNLIRGRSDQPSYPAAAGRSRRDSAVGMVAPHRYCSRLLQNRSADTSIANTTTRDKIAGSAGDAIRTASQVACFGAQS